MFIAGVFLCFSISTKAQERLNRYQKNLKYEAEIYFVQGDYYYASELYNELHESVPNNVDIIAQLGICYYHLPTLKHKSQKFLEHAADKGNAEAMYFLAKMRISEYKFFDALALIEKYEQKPRRMHSLTEIERLKASAQRAIQMVQTPLSVTIKNLGQEVNSELHDYAPVWDNQGEMLYFTSRRRFDTNSEKDYSEQYDENIYQVSLKSDQLVAHGAPEPLNTRTNDAAVASSFDGNSLIIYRTSKDGYSGDLYISQKDGYAWTEPEKLDAEINSKHQEASACFGNREGTVIYFSSDRPGGYGGKDLYKVIQLPDGSWSKAQNLGDQINTPFDEDGPYLANDGALYFASKGHDNMGGYDIFCAAAEGDGFKKPVNMGYPISTPSDDVFFTIDPTGTIAYFSSDRAGGYGLQDIYQVVFDDANTIIYKGEITTIDDSMPQNTMVTLLNEEDGSVEGLYQTNPEQSTFVLALNSNKKYMVLIEADGYQTIEKSMFFGAELNGMTEINEEIILSK